MNPLLVIAGNLMAAVAIGGLLTLWLLHKSLPFLMEVGVWLVTIGACVTTFAIFSDQLVNFEVFMWRVGLWGLGVLAIFVAQHRWRMVRR